MGKKLPIDPRRLERGLYWQQALSLVEGCTPVDETCAHCWSARQTRMRAGQRNPKMQRRYGGLISARHIKFNGTVRFIEADLAKPGRARKPRVWSVWNDLFHPSVTTDQLDRTFDVMFAERRHIYLVLTKRIERAAAYIGSLRGVRENLDTHYSHVYFGATAGTQEQLERRGPILQQIKNRWGGNIFLSVEPMLEPVSLGSFRPDGVVIGGESGSGARGIYPEWIDVLVIECLQAGVLPFVKQLGTWWAKRTMIPFPPGHSEASVCALGDRKGARMKYWPPFLRIRELPWLAT